MNSSPFELFRRNQRVLMAGLTLLSIFAFVFMDNLRSGREMPTWMGALLIGVVLAFLLWIIGQPRGKGTEWSITGLVVGFALGMLTVGRGTAANYLVTSNLGNLTRSEVEAAQIRRQRANRVVELLCSKAKTPSMQNAFGSTDQASVASDLLFTRYDAAPLGIQLNDEAVQNFIDQICQKKQTNKMFEEVKKELRLDSHAIFDSLKSELSIRLAKNLLSPPIDGVVRSFSQRGPQDQPYLALTPHEYWNRFQKLHRTQVVSYVTVPAEAFEPLIPEPTAADLESLFNQRKNFFSNPDGTAPGFMEPAKVQLAYLAAEYDAFVTRVTDPKEDEIKAYYEANRKQFIAPPKVETKPPATDKPAEEQPIAPPVTPEGSSDSGATPPAGEQKTEQTQTANKPILNADEPAAEKAGGDTAAEKPAEGTEPAKNDSPVSDLVPPEAKPAVPAAPGGIEYSPLDDDLKQIIKDRIRQNRAFNLMQAAADAGYARMAEFTSEPAADRAKALREFATERGMEYVELEPLSERELLDDPKFGVAHEPDNRNRAVFSEAFSRSSSVGLPHRADAPTRQACYAWTKLADVKPGVADFTNPKVKDRVAKAYRQLEAQKRAKARADELLELVKAAKDKSFAEALAGQTLAGTPDSTPLEVKSTTPFSWLRTSTAANPNDIFSLTNMPVLPKIEGLPDLGDNFMQKVFDELNVGDSGVTTDQLGTTNIVVHVDRRDGVGTADEVETALQSDRQQFLGEFAIGEARKRMFLPTYTPYTYLSTGPMMVIRNRWQESIFQRYNMQFPTMTADEME